MDLTREHIEDFHEELSRVLTAWEASDKQNIDLYTYLLQLQTKLEHILY